RLCSIAYVAISIRSSNVVLRDAMGILLVATPEERSSSFPLYFESQLCNCVLLRSLNRLVNTLRVPSPDKYACTTSCLNSLEYDWLNLDSLSPSNPNSSYKCIQFCIDP